MMETTDGNSVLPCLSMIRPGFPSYQEVNQQLLLLEVGAW